MSVTFQSRICFGGEWEGNPPPCGPHDLHLHCWQHVGIGNNDTNYHRHACATVKSNISHIEVSPLVLTECGVVLIILHIDYFY